MIPWRKVKRMWKLGGLSVLVHDMIKYSRPPDPKECVNCGVLYTSLSDMLARRMHMTYANATWYADLREKYKNYSPSDTYCPNCWPTQAYKEKILKFAAENPDKVAKLNGFGAGIVKEAVEHDEVGVR